MYLIFVCLHFRVVWSWLQTSHLHKMLWDIIYAAGFKLFPATTIPPCSSKTWKEAPWWHYCCSSHEAKAEPDMVVSTLVFRVGGIFTSEKRKGWSGGVGCELERRYAAKSLSLICKSPQAYLMHFWKAANAVENPALCLASRPNSSQLNHILPALSLHFQLERVLFLQTSCPKSLGMCLPCDTERRCCSTNRWLKWFTDPVAEALWDTPEQKAATEVQFFPSYCGEEILSC